MQNLDPGKILGFYQNQRFVVDVNNISCVEMTKVYNSRLILSLFVLFCFSFLFLFLREIYIYIQIENIMVDQKNMIPYPREGEKRIQSPLETPCP